MNISKSTLSLLSNKVRSLCVYWDKYMENYLEFWPLPGNFDMHTESHCERVLVHAMRIGEACGMDDDALAALAEASIFHDTRRKDNYCDVGHGDRGAEYYRDYCRKNKLKFLPETFATIKFHDRDDRQGEAYINKNVRENTDRAIMIYHIFKDSDALDRYRMGDWCLDMQFLRIPEAKSMAPFALTLVKETMDPAELQKMWDLIAPFKDKMMKAEKKE
jgi:hypothetical protein